MPQVQKNPGIIFKSQRSLRIVFCRSFDAVNFVKLRADPIDGFSLERSGFHKYLQEVGVS